MNTSGRTYLLHLDDSSALEVVSGFTTVSSRDVTNLLNTKFMKNKLYRIKHLITLADVRKGIKLEDT